MAKIISMGRRTPFSSEPLTYVLLPTSSGKRRWKKRRITVQVGKKNIIDIDRVERFSELFSLLSQNSFAVLRGNKGAHLISVIGALPSDKISVKDKFVSVNDKIFFTLRDGKMFVIVKELDSKSFLNLIKFVYLALIWNIPEIFVISHQGDFSRVGFERIRSGYRKTYRMRLNLSSKEFDRFLSSLGI